MNKIYFDDFVMYRKIFFSYSKNIPDDQGFIEKLHKAYGILEDQAREIMKEVDAAIAENEARHKFVVSYMHYRGDNFGKLDSKQMWKVYCQADGYGWRRASELRKINGGYDWSHIRDSTIDGWKRMEKKIKSFIVE